MPRGSGSKAYQSKIRRLRELYGLTAKEARQFYHDGSFRRVSEETIERFQKRYSFHRGADSRLHFFKDDAEVSASRVKQALSRAFYDTMVKRLQVWTGYSHAEVREYLARYENWKDGISPLYHEAD